MTILGFPNARSVSQRDKIKITFCSNDVGTEHWPDLCLFLDMETSIKAINSLAESDKQTLYVYLQAIKSSHNVN